MFSSRAIPKKSGQFYGALFVIAGIANFLVAAVIYKPLLRILGEPIVICIGAVFRTAGWVLTPSAVGPIGFAAAFVASVIGGAFAESC